MTKATSKLEQLLIVMEQLRDPETGCAWSQQQDFHNIIPYTIEEAYEVADAIARQDHPALLDELGDLLFQTVFYAQIAKEKKLFDIEDIAGKLIEKLKARNPQLKLQTKENMDAKQAHAYWQQKKLQAQRDEDPNKSLLADIPSNLPATSIARKIQQRAAQVGFDWQNPRAVIEKLKEEINELENELDSNHKTENIAAELGDIFFTCINLSRHLELDIDYSLCLTNQKFIRRFQYIERKLAEKNINIEATNLDELDTLWNEAKSTEEP